MSSTVSKEESFLLCGKMKDYLLLNYQKEHNSSFYIEKIEKIWYNMLDLLKGKNMKKLEINYDFIDKIYESEGKYKVKRFINNNKFTDAIIAGFVTKDIILGATGVLSPEQTAVKVTSYVATMSVILLLLESINQRLKENMTGKTQEERAEDELRELAVQLNNLGI